ncbi:MAG: poly-beta-hydroxybutyrate polymerase [Alphaproteobacteria bacterium CG_4_9_14_3_um_filter_47_13]|nr:MAG: poly-beta-hydroxybutyrate polymerase [Alphaproteobacteria bacterium CG_4_9_14_3_um_filter_47_13]
MKAQAKKRTPKKNNVTSLPLKKQDAAEHTFCGPHMKLPPVTVTDENVPLADRLLHAALGRIYGLSPASLGLTYADWLTHLLLSPGKQAQLSYSAWEKGILLAAFIRCQALGHDHASCCAEPMPQDRRFEDEGWQQWPYSLYKQIFIRTEQLWSEVTDVRGMNHHDKAVQPFMARQVLDMLSPLNFPLTNPGVAKTTVEQGGFNFVRGAQNFMGDWLRLMTGQQAAGMEKFKVGENIAVTRGSVVYQNRLIELIQYEPATKEVYAEPVLIVPAWIMKYYILDLSPENSLVKYLVGQGHTVFMISWKNPGSEDRDLGFENYLNLGIMDALKAVKTIVPDQKAHMAGYCLGGTLAAIAAAALARDNADSLKSLTLFAAQVDFEEAGELLMFTDESQLAWLEDTMWEKGYLDSKHMAGTFQMLRSRDLIWSRAVENYMLGERRPPNDLMAWNADATRMPYKMHREYLRSLFLNNDLSEGHFMIGGKPVALTDIRVPVFAVSTQHDHVAPWRSVFKIDLFADTNVTFVLTSGGHNAGIVSEPGHPHRTYQITTRKETDKYTSPDDWVALTPSRDGSWWPEWQKWLVEHSGDKTSPPKMGAPEKNYSVLREAPGEYVMVK